MRPEQSDPGDGAASERLPQFAGHALRFARRHGLRLGLIFLAVWLPLWGFAELADEVHEQEEFLFDEPLLRWAQHHHAPMLDAFFVAVSAFGYQWGVIPIDIGICLWLLARRRLRVFVFFVSAVAGSALLNIAVKAIFARERPSLWESIAPEHSFSFPSGHAMGSMTLATALVLLSWRKPWRWPALIAAALCVLAVGTSRVYLGVHYPSDILAGWTAALAWTIGAYAAVYPRRRSHYAAAKRNPL